MNINTGEVKNFSDMTPAEKKDPDWHCIPKKDIEKINEMTEGERKMYAANFRKRLEKRRLKNKAAKISRKKNRCLK